MKRDADLKLIRLIAIILMIFLAIAIIGPQFSIGIAHGDEDGTYTMYVICMPNDYINIRQRASTRSPKIGWLECGDSVRLDGKHKYGFWHCIGLTEYGEGWVYGGYLVEDRPMLTGGKDYEVVSSGRVAARKAIDGKRRKWVRDQDILKVWCVSEEWCLTNYGFVKTEYLEEV